MARSGGKVWDASHVALSVRRRRRVAWLCRVTLLLLVISIVVDHLGWFGRGGDDWSQFNHQSFVMESASDVEQIAIVLHDGSRARVHLLGVASADEQKSRVASAGDAHAMAGKSVTLFLEPVQTRDAAGLLLAYAFVSGREALNVDRVRSGEALADRREVYALHGMIEQAESEARKKRRGIWDELKPGELPRWRRDWLAQRSASRPKVIREAMDSQAIAAAHQSKP